MCGYALTLTHEPQRANEGMLAGMRGAGLSPREIIDVNQVVAYFNYVNRVAQGLGVHLEDDWPSAVRAGRDYELGS